MKNEIIINRNAKLIMTKDEFGYSEVLESLDTAKFIRIVTYNISKESDILINKIEKFSEEKDIIVITNIPGRFEKYTSSYAKNKAKKGIENYIERLNPDNYEANVKTFFNFGNHSKIIMSDTAAYIGSANFSDESRKNNECGVLIKDKHIISELDNIFVQMQIDESIPYYSSTYTKTFIMIANLLNQSELYLEEYYWSFFQDSGHQHYGRGDEYRGFDASLSPILIEKIESLSYEIEDTILGLKDDVIYSDIFEELNLDVLDEVKNWFGGNSDLEVFSRFDIQEKTDELFQEYIKSVDPDDIDNYAQMAFDDASEIASDLINDIYQSSLDGLEVLERLTKFLSCLLDKLDDKKEINNEIDNT